jgi:hypothetical protein
VIKAVERALGCDDIPVPHLAGRWIIHSTDSPTQVAAGSEEETASRRWIASSAVPASRTLNPVLAAHSSGWLR